MQRWFVLIVLAAAIGAAPISVQDDKVSARRFFLAVVLRVVFVLCVQ